DTFSPPLKAPGPISASDIITIQTRIIKNIQTNPHTQTKAKTKPKPAHHQNTQANQIKLNQKVANPKNLQASRIGKPKPSKPNLTPTKPPAQNRQLRQHTLNMESQNPPKQKSQR